MGWMKTDRTSAAVRGTKEEFVFPSGYSDSIGCLDRRYPTSILCLRPTARSPAKRPRATPPIARTTSLFSALTYAQKQDQAQAQAQGQGHLDCFKLTGI